MTYKVHKFPVKNRIDDIALERFINDLRGEVISIIPDIEPRFHLMGATGTVNCLIIVEQRND